MEKEAPRALLHLAKILPDFRQEHRNDLYKLGETRDTYVTFYLIGKRSDSK